MKDKWGSQYNKYKSRIQESVDKTKNEVITYKGKIIDALYFSMSAGVTQDVQNVFKEELDYLKSTESIYDNESLRGFEVQKEISINDFIKALNLNCINPIVDNISYNDSGYVHEITICNKTYEGNEFRKILNLRSANFKINITNNVIITTYGYGHGVGMSQYGANGYAKSGYNYKEILKHYYTDVEIKSIFDV